MNLYESSTSGFLTVAQNSQYVDYLRLAYLQALTIHATQNNTNVSVMITPGQEVPSKYREVFDEVIEVPWGDNAANDDWKLSNEWKVFHVTPYDNTIKVESDMLFFNSIDPWWDMAEKRDLVFTDKVSTYRGETVTNRFYREVFESNDLPDIYSGLMYFNKSDTCRDFFTLAGELFMTWDQSSIVHLDHTRPKKPSTDVVYALAAKLLGIKTNNNLFTFTHMKTQIQNVDTSYLSEDWTRHFKYYFDDDLSLIIENFRQTLPFHYFIKEFATDELITRFERRLGLL